MTARESVWDYPRPDVRCDLLIESDAPTSWCECKSTATYLDAVVAGQSFTAVGWTYTLPAGRYAALREHIAFYPGRVDFAWLGDEPVRAQPGDFYGGWITSDVLGPFKGPLGTLGW